MSKPTTHYLDITAEHCPMTFVKTKLKLERLSKGDVLEVTLNDGEPLENVPKTVREQGYEVLEIAHIGGRVHRVTIKK